MQGGDDVSMNHRAKTQLAILDDPKITVAYSLPLLINRYSHHLPNSAGSEFFRERLHGDIFAELFFVGNFICAPSVAMRTTDYLELGGFPVNVDALQDYALWLKASDMGHFKSSEEPVVKYRKHAHNLSKLDFSNSGAKRRQVTEFQFVIDGALSTASLEGLSRLRSAVGLDGVDVSRNFTEILIKSKHPNRHVRLSAVQNLLQESQNIDVSAADLRTYSVLINHILATCDPENVVLMQQIANKLNIN